MDIQGQLKDIALFNTCSADQLRSIGYASTVKSYPQGEVIIEEGSLADALYIIVNGSVQVFTKDRDNYTIILARLDEGNYFGEKAYLNNLIRTANVKALTDVKLIEISYDILDPLFKHSDKLRRFLQKTSLARSISNLQSQLRSVDSYVKKEIIARSERALIKNYKKGDIIFKKGDPANFVYFISTGSVALAFDDSTADDDSLLITKNHLFGEVGVLQKKPRAASARALSSTAVIAIPGEDFLNVIKQNIGLRSLVMAFSNVYTLPKHKAIAEQFIGRFEGAEAIFTKYKLHTGKTATCAKVVQQPLFTINVSNVKPDQVLQFKRGDLIERDIMLKDNIIVGIVAFGEWEELNILCEMLIDEVKLPNLSPDTFVKSGNILAISSNSNYHQDDIVCNCMSLSYQDIKEKIHSGCNNLTAIANQTGVGTACGTCEHKVLDILGQSTWYSAKIRPHQKFDADTCSYLITPIYGEFSTFQAGQYVSVKLQIDGLWVQRTYTITSVSTNSQSYEIIVRRHAEGIFTRWLFKHTNESLFIQVSRPRGKFVLNHSSERPILCLTEDVGIAPMIAFIRDNANKNPPNHFHVVDVIENAEVTMIIPDDIKALIEQKKYVHIEAWPISTRGHIVVEKLIQHVKPEYIYICGSDNFGEEIRHQLEQLNFNPENVKVERFLPIG